MAPINKLIIFDLDGVLLNSRNLHYTSLNKALEEVNPKFVISKEEHLSMYDGLTTTTKLNMLAALKGLDKALFDTIWKSKQTATLELLGDVEENTNLINIFESIVLKGVKIAVASNSVRKTVQLALIKLGVIKYVDYFVCNEDVSKPKPFPEMYWKCMTVLNAVPRTTIILEDSHIGRQGAIESGAMLIPITSPVDITPTLINDALSILLEPSTIKTPWRNKKMNVLIPMAGAGNRFAKAGYTFPKPLIEVNNKPMIQLVVENLNIDSHYIFLVQKEHYEKYNLKQFLNLIVPGCDIIQVEGVTDGAARTTLLADKHIDNDDPLLIANSDQFIEWNSNECLYSFSADEIDGGIITFKSTHPKWSFVRLGDDGFAREVAEKTPISDNATVGIYYWKKGSDYVKYAQQMIEKNLRVNNEFYVCPVFNEAIADGKKIKVKEIKNMWGLGTPEDLAYFLKTHTT